VAVCLTNPPSRAIAMRCSPELTAHREAHPPPLRRPPQGDEARPFMPATTLEDRLEFCRSPEAFASRQR
jgi:hypothetical protein